MRAAVVTLSLAFSAATWAETPFEAKRDEARAVLDKHCGSCHREDSPRADPRALAVFNLKKPDWSASMSDERLRKARGRLSAATPDELLRFDAFVAAELARRAHH
jgi:hypothetical protein